MKRTAPTSYLTIYDAIFSRIAQGHYRPVHRIGITALAQSLGVSTTPVREALRQLAGRDVVLERHREGFYLAPLNARAIISLYAAHELWMDRVLQMPTHIPMKRGRHRSLWRLFESRTAATGDPITISIRRYLDDRLLVLRRHEGAAHLHPDAHARDFAEALANEDAQAARAINREFHRKCRAAAGQLADTYEGHGQIRQI